MNAGDEYPTCLPSLGEECGDCHRCTSPDAPRPADGILPGGGMSRPAMSVEDVLAPVLAEAFDEWLHRMHGVTSSCDHEIEGRAMAEAAAAALAEAGIGPIAEAERRGAQRVLAAVEEAWLAIPNTRHPGTGGALLAAARAAAEGAS